MERVTIDPGVAAIVDIGPIGHDEIVPVYFTAEQPLEGTYEFFLWNSEKKNTPFTNAADFIVVNDAVITLTFNAKDKDIKPGSYYYEIHHKNTTRVVFKGNLNIVN